VPKSDNLTAIYEPIVKKMWKPRRLTTLWASTACYRDSFTFFYVYILASENNDLERCGRKPSWLILRYCPEIYLMELRKIQETSQDNRCPDRGSTQLHPGYNIGELSRDPL
jgi:hypothetical protein